MNELTNIAQLLQELPLFYVGVGVLFVLLFVTKNNFTQPANIPQKDHTSILALFTFFFAIIPAVYFGWGFYQAYFPDLKYDEVAGSVDFHVYQPQYLPPKIQQASAFHQRENADFDTSPTIRTHYGKNISQLIADEKSQIIVIDQSKTPTPFSLLAFIESRTEESESQVTIDPIQIPSFPNTPAYLVTNSIVSTVWMHTNDGVLISVTSQTLRTPTEELIKIAESLH